VEVVEEVEGVVTAHTPYREVYHREDNLPRTQHRTATVLRTVLSKLSLCLWVTLEVATTLKSQDAPMDA
jgi:hypothetical protein